MVPVITIPASRAGGAAAFAVAAPHDRGYHPYKEEEDGRSEGSLGECMMTVLCVCLPSHGESRGGGP